MLSVECSGKDSGVAATPCSRWCSLSGSAPLAKEIRRSSQRSGSRWYTLLALPFPDVTVGRRELVSRVGPKADHYTSYKPTTTLTCHP
ncbi:hypothetical protein E2C01_015927 [Portunus trituberculatus]|uniref:Uncharacterized protein n=1 Tax=Portunus trituberculatus TaxID=210409 RepID=A0A5B7DP99_PORTR|nr:hypothetical protein [Portunus trituberculatus]